jgi:hypothetical protein
LQIVACTPSDSPSDILRVLQAVLTIEQQLPASAAPLFDNVQLTPCPQTSWARRCHAQHTAANILYEYVSKIV